MTKRDPKAIGKRVAARRKELGLSQRAISGEGVSYAYVSRIENGVRTPSGKALQHLAERLRTTVQYLETGRKVVTEITLDEFSPYLAEVGMAPDELSHDEITRLGHYVHEVIEHGIEHPLKTAALLLAADKQQQTVSVVA